MVRVHATSNGDIPFTGSEEKERDVEEQAWKDGGLARATARLRAERDRLLAESDFTQLADAPLTAAKKVGWVAYRQALRDLPADTADPEIPVWPARPA